MLRLSRGQVVVKSGLRVVTSETDQVFHWPE